MRLIDNGNGTVTDNLTGLIWLKNANCTNTVGGVAKANGYLSWANALTWSNNLANGNCGLSDGSSAAGNQWHLITAVSDATTVKLYIDGVLDASTTGTHVTLQLASNFNIGRKPAPAYDYWGGAIDDLRIYNRALSAAEIQVLYLEANPVTAPTNGVCGSANGQPAISIPSDNLCAVGSATSVSGNGPWSWICQGANGGSNSSSCSVICPTQPAMITGATTAWYATGQDAYGHGSGGDSIKLQAKTLSGGFDAENNISVLLKGGYDDCYTTNTGYTTITGTFIIGRGTVTVERIIIR